MCISMTRVMEWTIKPDSVALEIVAYVPSQEIRQSVVVGELNSGEERG